MEPNSSTDLPESIFFTARKARVHSNTQDAASSSQPASSSSEYYSARMRSIMERKSELNMSQEGAEIEASKGHWTVVEPDYFTAATRIDLDSSSPESVSGSCSEALTESERSVSASCSEALTESERSVSASCSEALTESERLALYEENLKEMQKLQEADPKSRFFRIGEEGLVLGRKIAEGGQAEIYDAGLAFWFDENDEVGCPVVLKVFKARFAVRDLQKLWPLALLHKATPVNDEVNDDDYCDDYVFTFNPVLSGRLLGDGRFAFEMLRFWGDLRKLLDVRMEHNGNRRPPFMMPDGNYHECCMLRIIYNIAHGMRRLHREGTLHRDLKASNVLIVTEDFSNEGFQLDPTVLKHDIRCLVTDYECSIGVVGTRFWRAPEILEALKNRRVGTTPNLFTPKSDVYSFAMTCYEVLTGCIPFEEFGDRNERALVDDVLQGRRPTLPSHLQPWVVEFMNECWHMDPLKRPTFEKICDRLQDIEVNDSRCQSESIFFNFHD